MSAKVVPFQIPAKDSEYYVGKMGSLLDEILDDSLTIKDMIQLLFALSTMSEDLARDVFSEVSEEEECEHEPEPVG
jgi:hypothetical protein